MLASVEAGFERIDYAAWAHDADGIVRAISDATGDPEPVVEHLNTFEKKDYHRLEPIGPLALEALQTLREQDAVAEDVAIARGLIPRLSGSEADALFESAAARLGYSLS